MIESYPFIPDVIALMAELAESKNAPSATELFQKGADKFSARSDFTEIKVGPYLLEAKSL